MPLGWSAELSARTDKFEMVQAVAGSGLRTVKQIKVRDPEGLKPWVQERVPADFPLVVKPVNSAGTDGVRFCRSVEEVERAVRSLLGSINQLGIVNTECVVQTFLSGTEYIISSLSWDGRHHITDVWKLRKKLAPSAGSMYDLDELVSFDSEDAASVAGYACSVLDAVGVKYGPAHCEIMVTRDGPQLVEMGARIQGGSDAQMLQAALGETQFTKLADVVIDPGKFASIQSKPYMLRRHAWVVQLISNVEGIVEDLPIERAVKALPTYFRLQLTIQQGERIRKTVDLFSSPGEVFLVGEDRQVLERDYEKIREFEATGQAIKISPEPAG
jgi:biotin carboxylase